MTDTIVENPELVETEEPVGSLLADLERRQDDVLAQLDDLDRRVSELLRGLGVTLIEDSEAVLMKELSYTEVLKDELKVMDAAAVALCRENSVPIIVFNIMKKGNLKRILAGEMLGTIVK